MNPKIIICLFLVISNFSIFAQNDGELLASCRGNNLLDNFFPTKQPSNLNVYNVDSQFEYTLAFNNKKDRNDRVGQTLFILVPISFLMGTISAFDQGLNSKSTITFYSISLTSAIGLCIHKKKRRR